MPWVETWRRVYGDGKKFHGPNFRMTFFRIKFPFSRTKFLFFSHRLYFVCLLYVSTLLSEIYNIYYPYQKPRFQKKFLLNTFFSRSVLCLTSNNSTPSQIFGGTVTSPPKSPPVATAVSARVCF